MKPIRHTAMALILAGALQQTAYASPDAMARPSVQIENPGAMPVLQPRALPGRPLAELVAVRSAAAHRRER
jgi:hypothetical protein